MRGDGDRRARELCGVAAGAAGRRRCRAAVEHGGSDDCGLDRGAQRGDATPSRGGRRGWPDQRAGQPRPARNPAPVPARRGQSRRLPGGQVPELRSRGAPATARADQTALWRAHVHPAGRPKVVALTIDDGPSPVYTPQILQILLQYRITASFSMIGRSAAAFPGVAREVAAAGHMIVNRTWDHYNLGYMPAVAVQDEIAQATDAIHAATGERPRMFRAPYGVSPTGRLQLLRAGRADPAGLVGQQTAHRPSGDSMAG